MCDKVKVTYSNGFEELNDSKKWRVYNNGTLGIYDKDGLAIIKNVAHGRWFEVELVESVNP